jgi:DNA-binding transcriptional LysR family regulator
MIARDDLFMVASVNHAWATCKKLTVEDLTAGKWVLREDGSGTRAAFVKALGALGVPHGNLNIAIELRSKEAVLAAVLAGAGSTILSERVCAGAIRAKINPAIRSRAGRSPSSAATALMRSSWRR